jgi:hypothetical protein
MRRSARSFARSWLLVIALVFVAGFAFAQEKQRGFMIQLGVGPSAISYNGYSPSFSGVQKLELGLDLALGWAITQDMYLGASALGEATRFYDDFGNYAQMNNYLFGGCIRAYPFHTGLLLGLDAGFAKEVLDTSMGSASSPNGWGAAALVAWDFAGGATGFSFILGLLGFDMEISGDSIRGITLFLNLSWK